MWKKDSGNRIILFPQGFWELMTLVHWAEPHTRTMIDFKVHLDNSRLNTASFSPEAVRVERQVFWRQKAYVKIPPQALPNCMPLSLFLPSLFALQGFDEKV